MKDQIAKQALLALLILIGSSPIAFAGIAKLPPGSERPAEQRMKFDGIWVGPVSVTLIKQLDGYVILQGKDEASTWSARGVINGSVIISRGNGVTNGGHQFAYESSLTLKDGILQDTWKAIFSDGKDLKGDDKLERIEVEKPNKALQSTR